MPRWYYNLAFAGCSYSQGEFSHENEEYKITHRGLSYYLESNNYQTINVGQNGLSNRHALEHLVALRPMNVLHYLLIKTDPVRDLLIKGLEVIDDNIDEKQWKMWLTWWQRHHDWDELADDYDAWLAQQIRKQFPGHDFWVIGGLSKLNPDPYEACGIKVLSPSWVEQFIEPADYAWDDIEWLEKNLPDQYKDQTVDVIDKVLKKNDAKHKHEWFSRDGQHPDRNGHKLLYDKIISNIIREE